MRFALTLALLAGLTAGVRAEVTDIQAGASSSVQEYLSSIPGTINADEAEGDPREGNEGVDAFADVRTTGLGGLLIGQGSAWSAIADPTPLTANPQELSLEAGCFSNDSSVSYLIDSSVLETRSIIMPRGEIPAGGVVRSLATISGAVVVWSTQEAATLESIEGSIKFSITRGSADSVFEVGLEIQPDQGTGFTTSGGLVVQEVTLSELAELGVDEGSLDVLEQIEAAGTLLVLVIPRQERRYSYEAVADAPFTLSARIEASLRNAPGQTGIAVVIGRPFSNLVDFIESGLPEASGQKIQDAVNRALAERSADNPPPEPSPRVCGVLGLESVAFLLALSSFFSSTARLRLR